MPNPLTHDDVRRAAHEALRELHNIVTQMHGTVNDTQRGVQQMNGTQYQLNDIISRLTSLEQQFVGVTNNNSLSQHLQAIQTHLDDMHRRLGALEELVQTTHRYFASQQNN